MMMNQFSMTFRDNGDQEDKFCPVLRDPEPDCYCLNMDSQNIASALKYCQGNYLACDIYQRVIVQPRP